MVCVPMMLLVNVCTSCLVISVPWYGVITVVVLEPARASASDAQRRRLPPSKVKSVALFTAACSVYVVPS